MKLVLYDRSVDLGTGHQDSGPALTQFECAFVRYLHAQQGRAISRDELLVEVWKYPRPVPTRAVDTAVRRIRNKLEADPRTPRHLLTVRGDGYRWLDDTEPSWNQRVRDAERVLGKTLSPHAPEVGLTEDVREAYVSGTSALPIEAQATLALLATHPTGWTPAELASSHLPRLVDAGWVVADEEHYRIAEVWWPVAHTSDTQRGRACTLWTHRLDADIPVALEPIREAASWSHPSADKRALLLVASMRAHTRAGAFRELATACDALLREAPSPGPRCQLLVTRANALRGMGLLIDAREDAERALTLAQHEAPEEVGRAAILAAILAHTDADLHRADTLYGLAAESSQREEPFRAAMAWAEQGIVQWSLGRPESGLALAKRGLQLAVRVDDAVAYRRAARCVASILSALGRTSDAIARLEELYEDPHGTPASRTMVATSLGTAHLDASRADDALQWFDRAAEHARVANEMPLLAILHGRMAYAHAHRQDWEAFRTHNDRCIRMFDDADMPPRTLVPHCWAAVDAWRRGAPDEAERSLERAASLLTPRSSPGVRAVLALARQTLGHPDEVPEAARFQPYVRVAQRVWNDVAGGYQM